MTVAGDDHHARMLAACLGVAIRTLFEMEPDPKQRRRIARNMSEALLEYAGKETGP
jgi:hypothetical protein